MGQDESAVNVSVSAGARGGVPLLRVAGEIDMATAPGVRAEVLGWLETAVPVAVLDLTGVSFLASNGLALLAEAAQHAHERGAVFAVAADHHAVLKPLDITGMREVLTVRPDVDRAVAAVRGLAAGPVADQPFSSVSVCGLPTGLDWEDPRRRR
ncbi:STAS domain-containing protein [Saccharothrix algeriensis]|uniref:Anti-sigma factor antagonist n=1 Tax=Saccharothrix algeriensis TaxID=173560 RepID=A0A8T8HWV6_9PSEU|nr:STAS domain-containing protein [Saccharothrix algeriensis]MBM7814608.1 anti-anti-sigma factor [Saccharothrix algeriensis]QTR02897.1 STAS domain-containing protein [Saccharothrix algeriensis]